MIEIKKLYKVLHKIFQEKKKNRKRKVTKITKKRSFIGINNMSVIPRDNYIKELILSFHCTFLTDN